MIRPSKNSQAVNQALQRAQDDRELVATGYYKNPRGIVNARRLGLSKRCAGARTAQIVARPRKRTTLGYARFAWPCSGTKRVARRGALAPEAGT